MGWKIIPIESTGNDVQYGGDDTKKINKYLSGYDLLIDDVTNKVDIATPTTFGSEMFRILSPTTGFKYIFRGSELAGDRFITLPLMDDDGVISLSAAGTVTDWGAFMQTFRNQNIQFRN